ncbi:MAG: hypothetical protein PHU85_02030 [Phycisphaerae bacterium]|nr:hypothetical protein [Phycisphaerae bacterium]
MWFDISVGLIGPSERLVVAPLMSGNTPVTIEATDAIEAVELLLMRADNLRDVFPLKSTVRVVELHITAKGREHA